MANGVPGIQKQEKKITIMIRNCSPLTLVSFFFFFSPKGESESVSWGCAGLSHFLYSARLIQALIDDKFEKEDVRLWLSKKKNDAHRVVEFTDGHGRQSDELLLS
jgi:hypothetical protein